MSFARKPNRLYLLCMAARLWNKAPFVRLLAGLAAGCVAQWYLQLPLKALAVCFCICFLAVAFFLAVPVKWRYRFASLNGFALIFLLASLGALLIWHNDVRNNQSWFGRAYRNGDCILVTVEEPLVEKAASYKAVATVAAFYEKNTGQRSAGKIILYFKKDSAAPAVEYGSQIVLSKNLQLIKNAGNPGSFDYETYSLFQGITHQVYLTNEDYVVLPATDKAWFKNFIYNTRSWVVSVMQRFINGEKEQGLAEALLIGYKDDLDKNLVQAYSNTGVVHIIAISGLHLGLIYELLVLLTKPLKRRKRFAWPRLLLIVSSLWLFSILAGAGPSVLRSAVMFSLIALGEVALRKTYIINTLAFSAFVLLCIDPFWLWDVGFQLSYSAVLSIVLFFRPVYNWVRFQNKIINFFWSLTAVTISAQILTLPVSVYHFHQMPTLFLLTNFLAVPVSSGILVLEIGLCAVSFIPIVANGIGWLLHWLIVFMNSYIEGLNNLPFAVWNGLSINIVQCVLLTLFLLLICYWLMERQRHHAWSAAVCFALFMALRGLSFFNAYKQRLLIVYNVPKHPALDIIDGRQYVFLGDTSLLHDDFARNFHLQPSRVLHRISPANAAPTAKEFSLNGKRILWLDESLSFTQANSKPKVDVLVLSKNPRIYISDIANVFSLQQVVIDGSVPQWKAALWKKDCDSLKIPCHSVGESGAFVMNW